MKNSANTNLAASVHQRLLNVARETDRPFNEVALEAGIALSAKRMEPPINPGRFTIERRAKQLLAKPFETASAEQLVTIFKEIGDTY